jgi:hypothetical protein
VIATAVMFWRAPVVNHVSVLCVAPQCVILSEGVIFASQPLNPHHPNFQVARSSYNLAD